MAAVQGGPVAVGTPPGEATLGLMFGGLVCWRDIERFKIGVITAMYSTTRHNSAQLGTTRHNSSQ